MKHVFLVASLVLCMFVSAQNKGRKQPPVLTEISNKEVVQSIYPDAAKVDKLNDYWFKVVDDKNKVLGYAMSSVPYCKEVIGYNNTTPVMIITNSKGIIQKVSLLSHWETIGYIRKLERMGFFGLWNGKSIKEASKVELDAYTGATLTAKAVMKNVQFLLVNGALNKPKKM
ncbi:MAG: FMN-binding protein [Paludibacter sp.]